MLSGCSLYFDGYAAGSLLAALLSTVEALNHITAYVEADIALGMATEFALHCNQGVLLHDGLCAETANFLRLAFLTDDHQLASQSVVWRLLLLHRWACGKFISSSVHLVSAVEQVLQEAPASLRDNPVKAEAWTAALRCVLKMSRLPTPVCPHLSPTDLSILTCCEHCREQYITLIDCPVVDGEPPAGPPRLVTVEPIQSRHHTAYQIRKALLCFVVGLVIFVATIGRSIFPE